MATGVVTTSGLGPDWVPPENHIHLTLPIEILTRIFNDAGNPAVRRVCRAWRIVSNNMAEDLQKKFHEIAEIASLQIDQTLPPWQRCKEMWEPFKVNLSIYEIRPKKNVFSLSVLELRKLEQALQLQKNVSFLFFCRNYIPLFIQEGLLPLLDNETLSINQKAELLRIALENNIHVRELTHLEIQGMNETQKTSLTTLPSEIKYFEGLERLNLKNNALLALPKEVGQLPNLRYLWVSDNQLSSLPRGKGAFSKLQELSIHRNRFSSLPSSLLDLPFLQRLVISRDNHESPADRLLIENLCHKRNTYVEIKD